MDQIRLDPWDKLVPPTPRTHCQQNTLHPQDKKVPAAHPPTPEDNFWNSPYTKYQFDIAVTFRGARTDAALQYVL